MGIFAGEKLAEKIYAGDKPVTEVYRGTTLVWQSGLQVEDSGSARSVTVPSWAEYVFYAIIGGGGSGAGGNSNPGHGGQPGQFRQGHVKVTPGTVIQISPGPGGAASSAGSNGHAGQPTTLSYEGQVVSAPGGAGGGLNGDDQSSRGQAAGHVDIEIINVRIHGGDFTPANNGANNLPAAVLGAGGGGGNGGGFFATKYPGRPGGHGHVWMRFASSKAP